MSRGRLQKCIRPWRAPITFWGTLLLPSTILHALHAVGIVSMMIGAGAMTYLFMGDLETAQLLISDVQMSVECGGYSYEQSRCELVLGTILLQKQQYQAAFPHLSKLASYFASSGTQEDQICVGMRLVEC